MRPALVRRPSLPLHLAVATLLLLTAVACSDSTSPSHPDLNTARTSLLAADNALAAATTASGIQTGFAAGFTDSAFLLVGGPGIAHGRDQIMATLATKYPDAGYTFTWTPYFADVSAAADVGYTYGAGSIVYPASNANPGTYPLLYLAFWRKIGGTWKLEAWLSALNLPGTPAATPPTGVFATPTDATRPSYPSSGAATDAASVLLTDAQFSNASVYAGQQVAFTTYADALGLQMFSDYVYGQEAINAAFEGTPLSLVLSWVPKFAEVAKSNDLAFSVGEFIELDATETSPPPTFYGKYLSIWKRESTGEWRYLNDGGAGAPGPTPAALRGRAMMARTR